MIVIMMKNNIDSDPHFLQVHGHQDYHVDTNKNTDMDISMNMNTNTDAMNANTSKDIMLPKQTWLIGILFKNQLNENNNSSFRSIQP
jgi:hypothetical protein